MMRAPLVWVPRPRGTDTDGIGKMSEEAANTVSTPSPTKDLGETEDVRAGIAPINENEASAATNITAQTPHPSPCHDTQEEEEEKLLAPALGDLENAAEESERVANVKVTSTAVLKELSAKTKVTMPCPHGMSMSTALSASPRSMRSPATTCRTRSAGRSRNSPTIEIEIGSTGYRGPEAGLRRLAHERDLKGQLQRRGVWHLPRGQPGQP